MSEWAILSFFFLLVLFSNKLKPTKMKLKLFFFISVFYNMMKAKSESGAVFSTSQGELIRINFSY